ncbi:MAG: hypothetical protein K1Y36_27740 [Blastocatellia bacterium]|nr:hypothetical protein [Blastocatellia bacterium]
MNPRYCGVATARFPGTWYRAGWFGIILVWFGSCGLPIQGQTQEPAQCAVPENVRSLLPKRVDECAVAAFPGTGPKTPLVVAWSYRTEDSVPHSRLVVVARTGLPKVLWQSRLEELYNPVIEPLPGWQWKNHALLLVQRQAGLAWVQAEMIGFSGKSVVRLDTHSAEAIETGKTANGQDVLILHQRNQVLDLPKLLTWTGNSVADVSKQHPEFFLPLFERAAKELKPDFSTYTWFDVALLAALAGKPAAACEMLKQAIQMEEKKAEKAEIKLLRHMKQELSRLQKLKKGAEISSNRPNQATQVHN